MDKNQRRTPPGFATLAEDCMALIVQKLLEIATPCELKNAFSSCQHLYHAWNLFKSVCGVKGIAKSDSKQLVTWVVEHYAARHAMARLQRMGLGAAHPAIVGLAGCEEFQVRLSE